MKEIRLNAFEMNCDADTEAALALFSGRTGVELVVPELTRRGVYKREYRPGTLREKLFGDGRARLRSPHPAAKYRTKS